MIQRGLNIIDSRIRHSTIIQQLQPFASRPRQGLRLNYSLKSDSIGDPHTIRVKALISLPLRLSKFIAKDAKESVITAPKQYIAISSLETPIGNDRRYDSLVSCTR